MNRSWEGKGTYRNFEIKPGLHRSCATRWPRIGLKNLRQLLNESNAPIKPTHDSDTHVFLVLIYLQ